MKSQVIGRVNLRVRLGLLGALLAALVGQYGLLAGSALGSLNLRLAAAPDINASFVQMNYDPATHHLTLIGQADQLYDGSVTIWSIDDGVFILDADIDNNGNLMPSQATGENMLLVTGTIKAKGYNSGTLLLGHITAFGHGNDLHAPLEFVFDIAPTADAGDAAPLYRPFPSGGVIYHVGTPTNYDGDFTHAFSNEDGSLNTGVNPEPASLVIWSVLGIFGIVLGSRKWRPDDAG
jgi:hypothetical protein